ncbi:MAG TPA: hypothetical protein VK669_01890 [Candidatus Limnocylindrales bacterium]|nr:hypothetical protein [Candidatus Limnocylindrales bacterium]
MRIGSDVVARLAQAFAGAALLAAALALAGCAGSENASASQAAGGCASGWLGQELPAGTEVELLVAAGPTIPGGRWPAYRAMATAVAACAAPGTALTLRPITDKSMTELPVFTGAVPDRSGQNGVNELRYATEVRAFARREAAAVDRLPQIGKDAGGSDPLGALAAAGQSLRLGPAGSKHVVVAIFNGWQQTRALNLFSYQRDPAASTGSAVRALRGSGALPDLNGSEVIVVGLTPGVSTMQTSDAQLAGLCRFWRGVVEAGGGRVALCAAALPGIGDRG